LNKIWSYLIFIKLYPSLENSTTGIAIMIGLVIALMCNFYSIAEPGWKEIAIKAVAFGAIVTFWPILLLVISVMTCYSTWFKEEEEENFKTKSKLSNSPNIRFLKTQIPTRH
jgi:heme/copper-type cytochrome/quinol oxidase subunit 2